MLRPTIRHRTVQPRDSGRLAPPTEPTESHGGRPSIPTHNYAIFPISLTPTAAIKMYLLVTLREDSAGAFCTVTVIKAFDKMATRRTE